ncbi:hypothetical protein [Roseibium sp. SCP14]|uniref:hypothetical protein n=1 Tax=Roseibium sp. SCP14 TaxID=3141375 RepID=UPI00333DD1C0
MRTSYWVLSAFLLIMSAVSPLAASEGEEPAPSSNFVLQASSGEFDGTTLRLHRISEKTAAFADRPKRIVQSLSVQAFIERFWPDGPNSFKKGPSKAVIVFGADYVFENAVVEIGRPQLNRQELSFRMKVLEGNVPAKIFGPVLILDPAWNPGPDG